MDPNTNSEAFITIYMTMVSLSLILFDITVKCEDKNCQSNARCRDNKCACVEGYIDRSGTCEGKKIYDNIA